MRTLSRPMFNMGGPIKEGVMHGIREPYRGGGAALVGNPIFPKTGGRAHHAETPYNVGWNRIYGNPTRTPLNITGISEVGSTGGSTTATTGRIASAIDKAKKAQGFFQSPKFSERGAYELGKKYIPKVAKGIMGAAKWGLGRFPLITTALGGEYVTRPKDWEKEMDISRWDKLKRDLTPWYGTQEKIKQYQDWKELQAKKLTDQITLTETEKGPPGGTQLPSYIDPDKAKNLASAAKDKRLNNLLDIMGYDKSKSTAIHRALVDASQIVTQAPGGDQLDITKDIISPIIAATGKRLEKPADIREAVGLLMAKGEIEKDIAAGKGGPLKQNAKDLVAAGVFKNETAAMKHLASKKTMGSVVAEVSKQFGVSGANADVLDTSLRIKEEVIPEGKWKGDNKVYKEFKNNNKDKANIELEFVGTIDDRKAGDYYIVDKRIVLVDENLNPDYYY